MDVQNIVDLSFDTGSESNEDDDLPNINIESASRSQKNQGSNGDLKEKPKAITRSLIEERRKEKEEKQLAIQNNKIYKPGECMKHMFVEMHTVLLETWFCADIQRELAAIGAHLKSSTTLCDTSLVLWSRSLDPKLTSAGGMVQLGPPRERCDRGLYICQAEDLAVHVEAHTLSSHMAMAEDLAGCKLSLLVFGVKDYFKSSGRKTNNSSRKLMSEIELEMAITDLLVSAQIDTQLAHTPNELALAVAQLTKAIAEAPYKRAKRAFDEQADFYMKGDNKKCVSVDKDGNGVSRLWQQMVAVLPLCSLPTARSLCAEYPTPRALYEDQVLTLIIGMHLLPSVGKMDYLERLQSPDGVSSVAAAGVSRAAEAECARRRAVGPQLARKLHALLTADDGEMLLD